MTEPVRPAPTTEEWEAMLLAVCAEGVQKRAKCHATFPGLCDGKTDWCGACNRLRPKAEETCDDLRVRARCSRLHCQHGKHQHEHCPICDGQDVHSDHYLSRLAMLLTPLRRSWIEQGLPIDRVRIGLQRSLFPEQADRGINRVMGFDIEWLS